MDGPKQRRPDSNLVMGEDKRVRSASFERRPNDAELCSAAGTDEVRLSEKALPPAEPIEATGSCRLGSLQARWADDERGAIVFNGFQQYRAICVRQLHTHLVGRDGGKYIDQIADVEPDFDRIPVIID